MPAGQELSEQEFIERAVDYLRSSSGAPDGSIGPDTPLRETGWFDSLLLVSFLDFIEKQRGAPLPVSAETGLPLDDLTSIRTAYRLVVER